jgi:hypothetical protein
MTDLRVISTVPPLVSVLMPVYNASQYLKESINSILNQTYSAFELLIYNDGSSDDSISIIKAFASQDARIIFFDGPNCGLVVQLNKGLQQAKGKYIARMDADDVAPLERLAYQVAYMEANPEVGLCGGAVRMFGAGIDTIVYLPQDDNVIRPTLCLQNAFFHPAVTMRREVLVTHSLQYREEYMTAEDYQLWCEMSRVTQLHNLPEVVLNYRIHPQQVTRVQSARGQQTTARIRQEQMSLLNIVLTPEQRVGFDLLNSDRKYKRFRLADYQAIKSLIQTLYAQMGGRDESAPGVYKILDSQWYNVLQAAGRFHISLLPLLRHPLSDNKPSKAAIIFAAKCLIGWRPNLPRYLKRYLRLRLLH